MSIIVESLGGSRLLLRIGGHAVIADQPESAGGSDLGPTPTELFVASLAGCVSYYAVRFLQRRGVDTEGMAVSCHFTMSEEPPHRVAAITVEVPVAASIDPNWLAPLQRAVEHCTVHNTLHQPPEVRVLVAPASVAPAA
jgi:putative redox protein